MALLETVRQHKPALEALANQHGVSNIRVFGSALRGEDTPLSDIDLLVDVSKDTGLLDFAAFHYEANHRFNLKLDIVAAENLHPLLRDKIEREAQPL